MGGGGPGGRPWSQPTRHGPPTLPWKHPAWGPDGRPPGPPPHGVRSPTGDHPARAGATLAVALPLGLRERVWGRPWWSPVEPFHWRALAPKEPYPCNTNSHSKE
jgi:hypothetical protein